MGQPLQNEVKGKPSGIIRRIICWIWSVLLSCLLILCLYFEVPWTVITLIAIFLAAATILPRIYRKWFWLGVGVVILALIVWIFLSEDNEGWRPYTFDKELAQLQAKYAVPDSENVAIIYNQILENWKQKEANEPNLPDCWFDNVRNGPWFSKDHPEIAAYLWYHRDTLEGILKAAKFEKCQFPFTAGIEDFSKNLGRLSAARQWTYVLVAAGNNDLAEGNQDEAVEKYIAILQMGRHLSGKPDVATVLTAMSIESVGLDGVKRFIIEGNGKEAYLNEIERAVLKIRHDWGFDLPRFIDSDKLMFKNMFGGIWYQVDVKGRTRLSRDPSAIIRQLEKETEETVEDAEAKAALQKLNKPDYWHKVLFKTYTIPGWFYLPEKPDKLGKIIDTSYENNYQMAKPDFDWSKKPDKVMPGIHFKLNLRYFTNIMAKMNKEVYFNLHDTYLKKSAEQKGILLITALIRYKNTTGHWPEKLEDIENSVPAEIIIDPINRGSFVYKLTEDGFIIYSRGKNNIDEGGEHISKCSNDYLKCKTIKDDVMIWPTWSKSSESQEAKADANE